MSYYVKRLGSHSRHSVSAQEGEAVITIIPASFAFQDRAQSPGWSSRSGCEIGEEGLELIHEAPVEWILGFLICPSG